MPWGPSREAGNTGMGKAELSLCPLEVTISCLILVALPALCPQWWLPILKLLGCHQEGDMGHPWDTHGRHSLLWQF